MGGGGGDGAGVGAVVGGGTRQEHLRWSTTQPNHAELSFSAVGVIVFGYL